MKKYSVIIIGAGKIGAFFDTPTSREYLSHAHAFSSHAGFNLLGFVDSDLSHAERASQIWGGDAFPTVADAFSNHAVDVAVVAAPDAVHFTLLKELAEYPLKLVLAEKPLAKTVDEAEEIIAIYSKRCIRLAVNYSRRYVPEFINLAAEIASGAFGGYITGSGYYGKGTIHNGTHLISLLDHLLGEIEIAEVFGSFHDQFADDPTCSFRLDIADGKPFLMQAVSSQLYTIFELDLFFEKKRIRIVDSGCKIERYNICDSELFEGYRYLGLERTIDTSLDKVLKSAAVHIYSCLEANEESVCTGEAALRALTIACRVHELAGLHRAG